MRRTPTDHWRPSASLSDRSSGRSRYLLGRLAAVLVASVALGACATSSNGSGTTSTSGPPGTSAELPPLAISRTGISTSFSVLFDLADASVAPKLAVVQDGPALSGAFAAAIRSPLAKLAGGAKVVAVTIEPVSGCSAELLPSPCAKVVYDILSPAGKVLLAKAVGFAIYQSGKWLVAKITICTLLELDNGGKVPAGC